MISAKSTFARMAGQRLVNLGGQSLLTKLSCVIACGLSIFGTVSCGTPPAKDVRTGGLGSSSMVASKQSHDSAARPSSALLDEADNDPEFADDSLLQREDGSARQRLARLLASSHSIEELDIQVIEEEISVLSVEFFSGQLRATAYSRDDPISWRVDHHNISVVQSKEEVQEAVMLLPGATEDFAAIAGEVYDQFPDIPLYELTDILNGRTRLGAHQSCPDAEVRERIWLFVASLAAESATSYLPKNRNRAAIQRLEYSDITIDSDHRLVLSSVANFPYSSVHGGRIGLDGVILDRHGFVHGSMHVFVYFLDQRDVPEGIDRILARVAEVLIQNQR